MRSDENQCGCKVKDIEVAAAVDERDAAILSLAVAGMGCPTCTRRVRNALVMVEGVSSAYVTLDPPVATVRYDPGLVTVEELLSSITGAGADTRHFYAARPLG